ncbi:hypothetical protein H5S40_10265 [Limosilactobacillus sp. RRLNB_1_1]|uniref:Uncharacterized protein n=1 Tax=Limosilactobacillus albertensis TaxID=2759752 RepID=A0A7W3TTD2_9LACO|nr:hypothetical protein [Limosilactobacillus albertensis]MBB1070530.1 hypothetical protein [Limosilactobacillus albertensis]MCD7118911.1 hypothetical protein [Limosilactobacillus albertensis]MCD7129048.1 hypothetical protein [Limosilactobacillus albertensis]
MGSKFIVVTWYFYIVAIRKKILMNEVGSGEINQKRKIAIKRGIITGIFAGLLFAGITWKNIKKN